MKKIYAFVSGSLAVSATSLILLFSGISLGASTHCDFNNDGFDDLAIGSRYQDVEDVTGAGVVQVLYGKTGGLSGTYNQFWDQNSTNIEGDPEFAGHFGDALACGDFNGDGKDDLAIGAPGTTVNGVPNAGSVTVLYGKSKWRLSATGSQLWTRATAGIPGDPEETDAFGESLASGDFNGDGYRDLAIAVQGIYLIGEPGALLILYGSSNGLSSANNQFLTGLPSGVRVVAGNFGKDTASGCYDDLAFLTGVGVNDFSFLFSAIQVLYGTSAGLSSTDSLYIAPPLEGAEGLTNLATGMFGATDSVCGSAKIQDLVVRAIFLLGDAPEKARQVTAAIPLTGPDNVKVIYATNDGLDPNDIQVWTQDSPGIADHAEDGDDFGGGLAAGHTTSGHDYLAIGARGESLTIGGSNIRSAGVVHVLYTDPATGRLTATGSKYYHENRPGIKDKVEPDDLFGRPLATGNYDGTGNDDLAIGSPGESLEAAGVSEAGAVHILYNGNNFLTQWFNQNSADIKGTAKTGNRFGYVLCN